MDYQLEQWINAGAGANPAVDRVMVALAQWSEIAFIALVAAWFVYGVMRHAGNERVGALAALLASGLGLALAQLVSAAWLRPRPFITHPGSVRVLMSHSADASFPSDHVTAAVAISVVLLVVHRRLGLVALVVSVVVGYARVFAGVHYPGDVLGGVIVGLAAGSLLASPPVLRALASVDRRAADRLTAG